MLPASMRINEDFASNLATAKKSGMAMALGNAFVPDQTQTSQFDQEMRCRINAWTPSCLKASPTDESNDGGAAASQS